MMVVHIAEFYQIFPSGLIFELTQETMLSIFVVIAYLIARKNAEKNSSFDQAHRKVAFVAVGAMIASLLTVLVEV